MKMKMKMTRMGRIMRGNMSSPAVGVKISRSLRDHQGFIKIRFYCVFRFPAVWREICCKEKGDTIQNLARN